jgi:hypothetical protein
LNVDAVEQWAGNACAVALQRRQRARAFLLGVTRITAGAPLRCLLPSEA